MRETLTVAVAQPVAVAHDVAANAAAHALMVRGAGARVVVFPELSLTGYELDADLVPTDHPGLAPLVEACRETGTLALAGAPVDGPNIAILAVDGRTGRVGVAYRKVYLGGSEQVRFRPGPDGPAVVVVDGWRLGLAACKDTSIPAHQADTLALGVDAYVAGLCMFDHESDEQDARGQRIALEHGVFVAFASFAGSTGDGYDRCAGHSAIWGPDGAVLARAGVEPGQFVTAALRP
ncbi:carbon-nitrogen hydrolase family protein [Dactylosporangium siamense]|uniref:Hydrolase n=1 Tax=Dactylosporangium siamense TaxID=685454 RepID=A0A919UBJ9_9ACTN|nr:carbon-nitrogen hydrolase family protein [Dactylosporangium siamense]GIG44713.1 hydrolase [Dactylosporangium siamense]